MEIAFKLLGPTVVVAGDRTVEPPGRRIRTLLALLLTEPQRAVSRDRLGMELWGDDPPRSGPANLRNLVSSLREWLRISCGGVAVRTHDGVVRLADDGLVSCDVQLFEHDLRLVTAGSSRDAEFHLARAVAARRGTPFADIPLGTGLSARSAILEARWLSAVEDYADVLLRHGCFEEARDLLLRFTADNPTRERAWEQLMVAYYHGRDIAGALAVFLHARSALRDLLGVDPGQSLCLRHQAILRRDIDPPC